MNKNTGNLKLESILDQLKKKEISDLPADFSETIDHAMFLVPALLPPDTDPKLMKQMAEMEGENLPMPEGVHPKPVVLENNNGDKFLPAFTSQKHLQAGGKDTPKFPMSVNMPFRDCIRLLENDTEIKGIAVNPFSHNFVIPVGQTAQALKKEMTLEDYHVFSRRKFESMVLPERLFKEGVSFIEQLREKKGDLLREMYEEVYDREYACPYKPAEFDLMPMQIDDALSVTQIIMPAKYGVAGTAAQIIISAKESEEMPKYFAVIRSNEAGKLGIVEKQADGEVVTKGEVSDDSGVLSAVIEMVK